jgi:hypothetical protein
MIMAEVIQYIKVICSHPTHMYLIAAAICFLERCAGVVGVYVSVGVLHIPVNLYIHIMANITIEF